MPPLRLRHRLAAALVSLTTATVGQEIRAFHIERMGLLSRSFCAAAQVHPARSHDGTGMDSLYDAATIDAARQAPPGQVFDSLLARLRESGYNAIVSTLPLVVYRLDPDGESSRTFYLDAGRPGAPDLQVFREALEKVDSFGFRLIPVVPVATTDFSRGWRLRLAGADINDDGALWSASPVAPNPAFDSLFARLLRRLKAEYDSARISSFAKGSRPELWLSYDENRFADASAGGSGLRSFLGLSSLTDRQAVLESMSEGHTRSAAFRRVYARSLLDRLRQVRRELGRDARYFAWANAFIPQTSDGGMIDLSTWTPEARVCLTGEPRSAGCPGRGESIIDLPGLSESEKAEVRSGVVLAPWFYFDRVGYHSGERLISKPADIRGAARLIADRGFTMIPYCAFDFPETRTPPHGMLSALRQSLAFPRLANPRSTGFVAAAYPGRLSRLDDPSGNWANYWWRTLAGRHDQIPEYRIIELAPVYYAAGPSGERQPKPEATPGSGRHSPGPGDRPPRKHLQPP